MATQPWIVPDELWELSEPLRPAHPRRLRYPGRKRLPDRPALCGILFVLHTGIAWRRLPPELGCGSVSVPAALVPGGEQPSGDLEAGLAAQKEFGAALAVGGEVAHQMRESTAGAV